MAAPTPRLTDDPRDTLLRWQRIASDQSQPSHLRATARRAVRKFRAQLDEEREGR